MQTFSNPDWTFIINFFGIFFAILPIVLGIRLFEKMELSLIYWHNYTNHEKIPDQAALVRQVHNIKLVFENHGKAVIFDKDMINKIGIDFLNAEKIRLATIESNCKYNKVYLEKNGNLIQFSFDFLEPKKYIKLYIEYYSENRVKAKISGKIIGGNELNTEIDVLNDFAGYYKSKREVETQMLYFPFLAVAFFYLSTQLFIRMFHVKLTELLIIIKRFDKESWLIIFIILILALISIAIANKLKKIFIPFATFAEKEKNWFKKAEYSIT